jgi:hypothetical protein
MAYGLALGLSATPLAAEEHDRNSAHLNNAIPLEPKNAINDETINVVKRGGAN